MSYTPVAGDLAEVVRRYVAAACEDREAIAARVAETAEVPAAALAAELDAAYAARDREMRAWPAETDCTRLDRAFAALDAAGIVARQHFACCNSCGHAEIRDEVFAARAAGQRPTGYVFYHWQDTDRAVAGEGLHLRYGALGGDAAAIGRRIADALAAAALPVEWSGDPHKTIVVPRLTWQRREAPRVAPPAVAPLLDRWLVALPRVTAAEIADRLGPAYGRALVRVGARDAALAWARACREPARALAALGELREAYAVAPWGRDGQLVDALLVGGLADPEVRDAARERASEVRADAWGGAAVAWFAVRAAPHEDVAPFAAAAREVWAEVASDAEPAVGALAAALWCDGHVTRAEVEARLPRGGAPTLAHRAYLAAAAEQGELAAAEAWVVEHLPALRGDVIAALVGAGDVDAAHASAARGTDHAASFSRLARAAATDPRAAEWLAYAESAAAFGPSDVAAGLISATALAGAQLELAADATTLAAAADAARAAVWAAPVPPAPADVEAALAAATTRAEVLALAPAIRAQVPGAAATIAAAIADGRESPP